MKIKVGKIFRTSDLIDSKYELTSFSFLNEDGKEIIYSDDFYEWSQGCVEVIVYPIPPFAKADIPEDDVLVSDGEKVIPIALEFLHGVHEIEVEADDKRLVTVCAAIQMKKQMMEAKKDPQNMLKFFMEKLLGHDDDD